MKKFNFNYHMEILTFVNLVIANGAYANRDRNSNHREHVQIDYNRYPS